MPQARAALIWIALALALAVPVALAVGSPLLQWRDPIYIAAGFAGIIGMALMVLQPLLAGGYLPGVAAPKWRRLHRWVGGIVVAAVVLHVAGLWITSPPDVIDVLLFRSPTPFSVWGMLAMCALFATAALAALRRPLHLRWRVWRMAHVSLAIVIVTGTVIHALQIEGTMETASKVMLSMFLLAATGALLVKLLRQ